jgi:hypothetical protein
VQLISFTPQTYKVETRLAEIEEEGDLVLFFKVMNDGANLQRIGEISSRIEQECRVTSPGTARTRYQLIISEVQHGERDPAARRIITPYATQSQIFGTVRLTASSRIHLPLFQKGNGYTAEKQAIHSRVLQCDQRG